MEVVPLVQSSAPSSGPAVLGSARGAAVPSSPPKKGESHAYRTAAGGELAARASYVLRTNARTVAALVAFAFFVVFVLDEEGGGSSSFRGSMNSHRAFDHWGGAFHKGYFKASSAVVDDHTFRFAAVTDLDELSRVEDERKPTFRSVLAPGTVSRDAGTGRYSVRFDAEVRTLTSRHNEAGRGMELSELTLYQDRLLSFDDRTGNVFELLSSPDGRSTHVVPRFVITEGGGDTDKGMKWEWATVKDGELYIGSMGKEYTNSDGSVANTNNLWIAVINQGGEIRRLDWVRQYSHVRRLLGAEAPGYVIHEAVLWSDHLRRWVFLPRRVSTEMYDEDKDEHRGSNKLVLVDERFADGKVVEIPMADKDGLHGFSSFAFVPGTRDRHAMALRTVEDQCQHDTSTCTQMSYVVVFDVLTGEVLMDEVKVGDMKFEGLEFVDIETKSPVYD